MRRPDLNNQKQMTARGWILILLNLVFPGSAQLLAGNRTLARIGLFFTTIFWILGLTAGILWFTNQKMLINFGSIALSEILWLWVIQIGAIIYGVLWLILTIDTIRLTKLIRVGPFARWILALLALFGLVVSEVIVYQVVNVASSQRDLLAAIFIGQEIHEPINGRYNIMLLGADAGDDRWGLRPDSLSVVSVDMESGQVSLIGIPRNLQNAPFSEDSPLWNDFPNGYNCGEECLVSFLYTYGMQNPELYPDLHNSTDPGIEATRDALEGVTGLEIQYYVMIDMAGFANLIDAMGGVTIDVEERIPMATKMDANGNYVNLEGWIEPGKQTMDGYTALWYARSRVSTNDYDRMQRQRQVQEAIVKQFEPAELIPKYREVAQASSTTVSTDIPSKLLSVFADKALDAREHEIQNLELTPPKVETFAPDFDVIHQMIAEFLTPPVTEDDSEETDTPAE